MTNPNIKRALALINKPFVPPQKIVDEYPLDFLADLHCVETRPIASGGTSDIFLGTLTHANGTEDIVAIKILHGAHCDPELGKLERYIRRLSREAQHLTKVAKLTQHDNIVPFFGFSQWGLVKNSPSPGLVSLYYEHKSVIVYLEGEGRKTPEIRLNLIRDVANGLNFLHGMGMIHGDIKPNNVLVDGKGRAALCDFGQARIMDIPTGYTTAFKNNAQYTAPELLKSEGLEGLSNNTQAHPPNEPKFHEFKEEDRLGRITTFPADVYAFAMTILEVSSGVSPFKHLNNVALTSAIGSGKRPDRDFHTETSALDGLWEIIENCWVENPQKRPQMAKVMEDLEGVKAAKSSG